MKMKIIQVINFNICKNRLQEVASHSPFRIQYLRDNSPTSHLLLYPLQSNY